MDYGNLAGFAIGAAGGLIAGMAFGRKLAADGMAMLKTIESRLETAEWRFAGSAAQAVNSAHAGAVEKHAGAIARLADAIEKHGAAIDDHGAAMVAAAVETHTELHPQANGIAAKNA
ncbi:MAG TPA: hypothetical protein VMF50_08875 [Candidatus Binataceae bacterium]|nr:hypothetical protein [Candidatus Binataceae bacterium]